MKPAKGRRLPAPVSMRVVALKAAKTTLGRGASTRLRVPASSLRLKPAR